MIFEMEERRERYKCQYYIGTVPNRKSKVHCYKLLRQPQWFNGYHTTYLKVYEMKNKNTTTAPKSKTVGREQPTPLTQIHDR